MPSIHLETSIPGPKSLALLARKNAAVARGLATAHPLFVDHASGATLTDVDGNTFIDFTGGIGAMNVGHSRPELTAAIAAQAAKFLHTAIQVTAYESYVALAEKLCAIAPMPGPKKAFLVTTGTEAVENAVKLARAATGRPAVIAFEHAFHGRSLGGLSLTSRAKPYKQGFGPFLPEIYRLPYPTYYRHGLTPAAALAAAKLRISEFFRTVVAPDQVACLVLETVLGEGGFLTPPPGFLEHLREVTREHGIVFVIDEVQCGFCRTGKMFAVEHFGVEPDLVCMAKSLGGGMPVAAVVGRASVMDAAEPGALGGTYAGNPLACVAALAAIDVMEKDHLAERAAKLGDYLRVKLDALAVNSPLVGDVRGLGAMLALELVTSRTTREPATAQTAKVLAAARARGLLLLATGTYGNVIRILVPLVVETAQLDEALDVLAAALAEAA